MRRRGERRGAMLEKLEGRECDTENGRSGFSGPLHREVLMSF
jgi:hypothetical protein